MSTYVVLGTPRGGTSAVAGLLRILGIPMGYKVSDSTHEDLEMRQASPLSRHIAKRNSEFDKWGWKDPTLIDRFKVQDAQLLRDPHFICVFRDPLAVASTERDRANMPFNSALIKASQRHEWLISFMTQEQYPVLGVSYEEILRIPGTIAELVAMFCDEELGPMRKAQAMRFLHPGYRRISGEPFNPEEDRVVAHD